MPHLNIQAYRFILHDLYANTFCMRTMQTSTVKRDKVKQATYCAIMSKLFFQLCLRDVRWQTTNEDLLPTVLHVLSPLTNTVQGQLSFHPSGVGK